MHHKRLWIALLPVAFCFAAYGTAPGHEERAPAIIDTDMALDDVRALVLMLGSSHLDIKAVVTSDGASTPEKGCENVKRVLHFLGRDHISVAAGRKTEAPAPPWREMSENLGGATLPETRLEPDSCRSMPLLVTGRAGKKRQSRVPVSSAAELIVRILGETSGKVSYLCTGPLTNLADVLTTNPILAARIGAVYYFGTLPGDLPEDWNTGRDRVAARKVFAAPVRITALHLPGDQVPVFDPPFLDHLKTLHSPAANLITGLFQDERPRKLLQEGHFRMWDETVALYVDSPELASLRKAFSGDRLTRLEAWKSEEARRRYIEILKQWNPGDLAPRQPVVLDAFPAQTFQFQEDLRPYVAGIIARHGLEEWKATVLTNELHRHLGIYSILGAKMGILARELLGASLDELAVESRAGLKPPLSCLNDGLQVSTGASLGRGTITVVDSERPAAEAVFIKGERRLQLTLKGDVSERIRKDIRKAIERYGNLTPQYFAEVRRLSLEYWRHMTRGEIFESKWESSIAQEPDTPRSASWAGSR